MRWGLLFLALALAPSANLAAARADPARVCQAAQIKSASKFMKSNFRCWAKFFKNLNEFKLVVCLAKADQKFVRSYDKALCKAGPGVCALDVPPEQLLPDLADQVDELVFLISADSDERFKADRALHAALNKAVGKAISPCSSFTNASAWCAPSVSSSARARIASSLALGMTSCGRRMP